MYHVPDCHITATHPYNQQGTDAKDRNEIIWLCQFVGTTSPMKDSLVAEWEQCKARWVEWCLGSR